jgi:hypothetical protein
MQEREAALAAARLHRQPDTKPYVSYEDLLKKAEACLRFSRRAYERNLTGRRRRPAWCLPIASSPSKATSCRT